LVAELHAERYGEFLRQDSALPENLKSLLRKEALGVFENRIYGFEELVDSMFLDLKY
jgi:hypothetical protein